jgi:hypothetical protein
VRACLVYRAQGRIFNNMLCVWYVHLTKGQAYSKDKSLSSSQRGCYVRPMTIRIKLKKQSLVVILKGLGAKRKWLAVYRVVTLNLTLSVFKELIMCVNYNSKLWLLCRIFIGFEVVTAVSMKIAFFWVVTPCSSEGARRSRTLSQAKTQKAAGVTTHMFTAVSNSIRHSPRCV